MKLSSRFVLPLLLGAALATTLSSCEYHWSPGEDPQFKPGFTNPPGYHTADINRDSINNQPQAPAPIGVGSAKGIRNAGTKAQINSAPAGASAATPQNASGQMGSTDNAQPTQ